ncbi:Alpha-amylase precursor [Shewanella khirikhana]|uniref:Alpha-amylase n=2 Tax=Shewanella khirikhana TaxID=1965282 RepID=A0ABN5TTI2_9GAMM|nr:Alpha-amylase precursor [Shewanella khirikhana]
MAMDFVISAHAARPFRFKRRIRAIAAPLLSLAGLLPLHSLAAEKLELNSDISAATAPDSLQTPAPLIYQLLPRVFGNQNLTNKPWGSIEENGSGKFADINDSVLADIADLGVTHVWYTGVLHHASLTDYSAYGIDKDDADVVKGIAGSPYAIRDYYNVNPDLALDPAKRLDEFKALIERTHAAGLKVIIDIVPNHVARRYRSISAPEGVEDFGARDITSVVFDKHNNFYYVPGSDFLVPQDTNRPPASNLDAVGAAQDGRFAEKPAKWTGNGSSAKQQQANQPGLNAPKPDDWYETVKLNYGVAQDGTPHFPALADALAFAPIAQHQAFWARQTDLPDTWLKMRDISRFWLDLGVDGFRFDMAEMVPVAFWSFLASDIKAKRSDALLIAEVYNPKLYPYFIGFGKLDLLYDKVGLYDTLKAVSQGKAPIGLIQQRLREISRYAPHMLHFLENHDEQRIASPEFLGDAQKALPALAVSTLATDGPFMLYFGQTLGEDGSETGGFGKPSRTSIFDYVAAPAMARYLKTDPRGGFGSHSQPQELALRADYRALLALAPNIKATPGAQLTTHQGANMVNGKVSIHNYLSIRRGDYLILANFSDSEVTNIANPANPFAKIELLAKAHANGNDKSPEADVNGAKAEPQLLLSLPQRSEANGKELAPWGVNVYKLPSK